MPRFLLAAALVLAGTVVHAAPDAQALLARADHARGGGLPGIVWQIDVISRAGARVSDRQRLEVRAVEGASVAETLEPARFKGSRLLQVGHNMWLSRPGLSKPVPISPRQRLSGEAANGDIAATNYAADYTAEYVGEEAVDGEACHLLALTARHKRATYDRVRYWISARREVAVRAEFHSVSGKLLKTARFDYANQIDFDGRRLPFVSRMVIRDALIDAETTLDFGAVTVRRVAPAEFDLGQSP